MSSQQAEKAGKCMDSTKISSNNVDRSTGTSGQLESASTAEPQGSSALGDSNFAGMSTVSAASNQRQKIDEGNSAGQDVGGASQPWSVSSAAP